jgi:nitrogen fixation NifU-like protein
MDLALHLFDQPATSLRHSEDRGNMTDIAVNIVHRMGSESQEWDSSLQDLSYRLKLIGHGRDHHLWLRGKNLLGLRRPRIRDDKFLLLAQRGTNINAVFSARDNVIEQSQTVNGYGHAGLKRHNPLRDKAHAGSVRGLYRLRKKQSELELLCMYSVAVLDHFEHPRNAGDLPDATVSVRVENPVCGDIMQLSLKLDGGIITSARFRTRGCVASIACSSLITELIQGKSTEEAGKIGPQQLADALGSLPRESQHATHLAIDALAAALAQLSALRRT